MQDEQLFDKLKADFADYDIDVALDDISTMLLDPDLLPNIRNVLVRVLMYYTEIKDMLSISESYQPNTEGYGYYASKLSPKCVKVLRDFLHNIDVESDVDFHMTLMYDVSEPVIPMIKSPRYFVATVDDIMLLGKAIVLKLDCLDAKVYHMLLKEAGLNHSFDDYMPHMSLVYKENIENDVELINKIKNNALFFKSLILEFESAYREPIDGD